MTLFLELLACVLIFALGIIMLARPDIIWRIDHLFTVKNGEPTDLSLAIIRVTGLAFLFIAVIGIIIFLIF